MDANYFANLIANAPIQSSSRYFEAGVYHVKIDGCKMFENRQRRPRAAVECTVIESNNAGFPATSQVSWIVALDNDSGPSTIRSFIADLTGCTPAEASAGDVILKFFPHAESNPDAGPSVATGLHAIVNAFEKPTKSGGVYTRCGWRKYDPVSDEPIDFASMPAAGSSVSPVDATPGQQPSGDPIPF